MPGWGEPRWQLQSMRCLKPGCSHTWSDWLPINVRVAVWVAVIHELRCPECGGDYERIAVGCGP